MIDREFDDVLACPQCKGPLAVDRESSVVRCERCRRRYPVQDGFPILLVDEAVSERPPSLPRRRTPTPPR